MKRTKIQTRKLEAHKTFELVVYRTMLKYVNAPRFGSYDTRGLANWGPFPSATVIAEADQKLSSGGEGRLTRSSTVQTLFILLVLL